MMPLPLQDYPGHPPLHTGQLGAARVEEEGSDSAKEKEKVTAHHPPH